MPRALSLALLVLLSSALLGGTCSESEAVPLEELQRDMAPAFAYSLYCDEGGTLVGERSAVLLVYRAAHLERVYADSRAGNPRAQALFGQLENAMRSTGTQLARQSEGIACHSLPACVVQWHKLDEFMPSRGEGGVRLRQVMADSFSRAAKLQHVSNTAMAAVLDVLLVGTVLQRGMVGAAETKAASAEAKAAAVEATAGPVEAGRLAVAGLEARLAAKELAVVEVRLAEEEALATAARHPRQLEALARHRPASSQPPSGVEAEHPRWTSYVTYWHRRYEELAGTRPLPPRKLEVKPPLTWESYSALLGRFQRSLEFQRAVTRWLQQHGSREWLPGMKQPLVIDNMGLKLEGRTHSVFADQLALDQATLGPGLRPSVHTFSNKQRDFAGKSRKEVLGKSASPGRTSSMTRRPSIPKSGMPSWTERFAMMSNSTSSPSPDDWDKSGSFLLRLISPLRPLDQGFEALEPLLKAIESLSADLRPDRIHHTRRELKYSRQKLRERLTEAYIGNNTTIRLVRSQPPDVIITLDGWEHDSQPISSVEISLEPFSFVREPGQAERRAEQFVSFVRAVASHLPLSYGLGHSFTDLCLSTDPRMKDLSTPRPIYEAFWLNVYGPAMVQALGRERLLSTPAFLMEELSGGAVLWLTRPTPADFESEEARLSQARALVHLCPELSLDSVLATLRQRSLEFSPIPMEFDPDVADILRLEADFQGVLGGKRKFVERFNRYHPPAVSEWLPASQAPAPDVEDVQAAIKTYEELYSEQLIALFHKDVPQLMQGTLEALPHLDQYLWHAGWGRRLTHEQRETLVPALGAFLGRYLVEVLGGRWLPRKKLEEAAVLVGDRAWLPFLRARHALQNQESPLDFSCSQLFLTAQRLARAHAH